MSIHAATGAFFMALCFVADAAQDPDPTSAPIGFSSGVTLAEDDASDDASDEAGQNETVAADGFATPWWQIDSPDSQLRLERITRNNPALAGQAAIGLWFSQPFARDTGFGDQLAVYDINTGSRVAGSWQRGNDPTLLFFVVPRPGRYLLRIRAGLRDAAGHTFNHSLSGPVVAAPAASP